MDSYDFVIVGGGTAGCVLAARLSENPDVSVLLVEAVAAESPAGAEIPPAWPALVQSPANWGDVALGHTAAGASALHPLITDTILKQWRRLRQAGAVMTGVSPRSSLTPRELDVLAAMPDGLATKAIATKLGVALKTVENHKIHIFD